MIVEGTAGGGGGAGALFATAVHHHGLFARLESIVMVVVLQYLLHIIG